MVEVIEVKPAITETIAIFPEIVSEFNNIKNAMNLLDGLLSKELWLGNTKDKCGQIQGLLTSYCEEIKGLVTQLEGEVTLLKENMENFESNSECVAIINSI